MFTSVAPSLIILKCSCRTMLGLLTKPNACNKFSSVDRRHFIQRLSLPTMLAEREDLFLRHTRRFAFHQCLVCKSYNKRRHSTHHISSMPALLKKQRTSPSIDRANCAPRARAVWHIRCCIKTKRIPFDDSTHVLLNNTPTNTIPLLIRWILAAHG